MLQHIKSENIRNIRTWLLRKVPERGGSTSTKFCYLLDQVELSHLRKVHSANPKLDMEKVTSMQALLAEKIVDIFGLATNYQKFLPINAFKSGLVSIINQVLLETS